MELDKGVFAAEAAASEESSEDATAAFWAWTWLTMFAIFPGFEERVMTVVTPAEVARRAATILVDMPPLPKEEPADDTSASTEDASSTTSIA